ncbi:MAG TPA: hypothetical protein DCE44_14445 [Verrucomicrobiales bacterium]|nr:hypothetical protein [Verrucomicrobiales bacterium]
MDVAHNTVITDRSNVAGAALCLVTHGRPENIRVWNNLFVTRGQVPLVRSEALPGLQVVGNVWWNDEGAPRFLFRDETFHDLAAWRAATGLEQAAGHETGIVADPGLHLSDETLTVGDRNWLDVLASYRLPLTSPMRETEIRSASWLASLPPGIRDFFEQVLDGQAGLLPGADARVIPVQKK